ncbi:unnamed protein product [marine sediment metagenome]|uniref:Uncharacterized protein n=1 Tax=marine sediment metagenome TaxID=412755 RepID=X1VHN7_9ZZZZ
MLNRWDTPKDKAGKPVEASAVYAISLYLNHEMVLNIDDNAFPAILGQVRALAQSMAERDITEYHKEGYVNCD